MCQTDCVRSIWIVGAIIGLVVMLFASVLGATPWPGGLFLGVMTGLLLTGLLRWLILTGRQAEFDARLPKPPLAVSPGGRYG